MRRTALAFVMFVSFASFAAAQARERPPFPPPHDLLALDTNYDGAVSRQEFMTAAEARFARMDRNHDQVLDSEDRPPRWDGLRRGPRWGERGRDGRGWGGEDRGGPREWRDRDERSGPREWRDDRRDDHGDEHRFSITRAQFLSHAADHFRRLDANHNGRLSGGELDAFGPPDGHFGPHRGHFGKHFRPHRRRFGPPPH